MVARRKVWKSVGQIVLGFGILFLGLSLMSTSVIPLQDSPAFGKAMKTFGTNPVLGVLIGLVTTLVVQSSAATIGMLMALAISSPDLVTLEVAIPILLGDNIGTCITAILSGIGASVTARRTAMAHLMFNVFGALIFLPFIGPFKWVVEAVTRSGDIQRQIANAHTLFNVANTVIWLPATGFLERVVSWLVPGEDTVVEIGPKYLDRRMLGTPPIALDLAVAETVRMGEIVQEMLDYSRKALTQGYTSQLDSDLESREQLIDDLNREVVLYLSMVAQSSLNEAESRRLAGLMHAVGDVERIGDVAEQLMFYAREKFDQGLTFSETAMKELEGVFDLAEQMLARGVVALRDNDMEAVEDVYNIHKKLDETTNMLRANHIGRLNEGKCVPGSGVIFVELMNSLERMGDLSVNLADAVSGKKSPRVEPRS
jgi:phosphate:Na+ symporter